MYSLHTHTFYCNHGEGTVWEYVAEGEAKGLSLLGFSEHNPFPGDFLTDTKSRMYLSSRRPYEEDVKRAREISSIPVLLGYECDWYPGYEDYIRSFREDADYLLLGVHYLTARDGNYLTPFRRGDMDSLENMERYLQRYISGMESGLFLYGCHPDVYLARKSTFGGNEKAIAKDLIAAAKDLGMVLEVNANGIQKAHAGNQGYYSYPRREFWEMAAEENLPVVIGPDAHKVEDLTKYVPEAYAYAKELGLKVLEPVLRDGGIQLV